MNPTPTTASQSVSSSTATSAFPFPGLRTAKPDGPVTATVRPTPPISIPYPISSYASNSPFDDPVWTIPPIPVSTTTTTTETTAGKVDKSPASTSITSTAEPLLKSVFSPICSSSESATPASQKSESDASQSVPLPPPLLPPPPPPSTSHGPWSPNIFRPVPTSTLPTFTNQQPLADSAFHTPPPVLAPTVPIIRPLSVVRPPSQPPPPPLPAFSSPQLPCVLPPPPLAYITDVSTPSASTQSTTISNAGSDAANKDIFPSPPIADIETVCLVRSDAATTAPVRDLLEPSVKSVVCAQPMPVKPPPPPPAAPGLSPGGISRVSSGSGNSIREAVLCSACGQMHDPHQAHVYDYSEPVDADLLCRICRQPLVDPLDTKCGHTFCTPCLKSHLVVQALCPEDKQIINYLECQQSSNLVKRLLDKLLVICPNTEHCDEVLCRCDLESHLTYWCRGSVIPCLNAKAGCQFRAARALHTEHRRECRFQTRNTAANFSGAIVGPGSAFDVVHQTSPVIRSATGAGTKSAVRFGPMPSRRGAHDQPGCADVNASPLMVGNKSRTRSVSPIRDCEVTTIELPWQPNERLGISFVGGSDTPLLCVVIQEIYLDGLVALDGRLRPGDQILETNGVDLTQATHHQARMLLSSITASRPCTLTVYRERASSETGSLSSGKLSGPATTDNPFEGEEILHINLLKRLDKRLGIKLVGKKNLPGLYILGVVPDSEADLDGRLHKDDRILEINGVDLREGTQDEAANIIRSAGEHVSLVVARVIRPQTPDIIRTASGDIVIDYGADCTATTAGPGHPALVPPAVGPAALGLGTISPPSLKSPSTRLCREQVLVINKRPGESLGMTVAGGVASQRGDTPVYVTDFDPSSVVGRMGQLAKGDVLLAVNEVELLGLSHERAVEALKSTRKTCSKVTLRLLEGPETSTAKGNFLPSWLYWLQLPRYCQIPKTIVLSRTSASGSFGFSIVGGNNSMSTDPSSPTMTGLANASQREVARPSTTSSSSCVSSSPQPIVVKSIVPGTPAHRDGRLKCGDLILAVNQFSLADVSHAYAVALLKNCVGDVQIRVVSWPGTIV